MLFHLGLATIALQVACAPDDLSRDEAKALVIKAAMSDLRQGVQLDAQPVPDLGPPDAWTFRVFATNLADGSASSLVGWFSVNKRTAALTDPVDDDKPIEIPQIAREQAAPRARPCY